MPATARASPRIPVTLLTGFLGSGKTTLVNALLRHPELADTAVIVNEFGAIGLDHLLVASAEDNVVLLGSGCLCCAAQGGLRETLADLFVRRVNGAVPRFTRVLIETSGLADPGPIVNWLAFDALLRAEFELSAIVATVDGQHGQVQLDEHPEARQQAALADLLILTKSDLADPASVHALRDRLAALNPIAPIMAATHGAIAPDAILETKPHERRAPRWLDRGTGPIAPSHLGAAVLAQHTAGVRSIAVVCDHAVSWSGLAAWSALASATFGRDLLRVKGILEIAERGKPVVVHAVAGLFHRPHPLDAWPGSDHRSRLVIITRNIDPAALRTSLEALALPAGAHPPTTLAELAAMNLEAPHAV